ncbi:MAG: putative toxin-antitoxin system toxin component, PIN family [Calditrichaceae bacterium]|nr:putative toxin-antitoxin system toxin component, PIN family [Calditrichia bacterium]NUQ43510.1 putative toxin-antitoxin system toxin component, PIN family [Calditrichaceae bacterium]
MIVTVDTNVIFSALYSNLGASHQILKLILEEKIELALSPQIYFEYYDMLVREDNLAKLNLMVEEVEDILDLLALLAQKHSIYFLLRPNLIDEKDNMVVECAFASNSEYLITSNVRHFKSSELKGFKFKVVTPREFYKLWESSYE